jgi:hypothetical protein
MRLLTWPSLLLSDRASPSHFFEKIKAHHRLNPKRSQGSLSIWGLCVVWGLSQHYDLFHHRMLWTWTSMRQHFQKKWKCAGSPTARLTGRLTGRLTARLKGPVKVPVGLGLSDGGIGRAVRLTGARVRPPPAGEPTD